jgi:hypothetical protein
MAWAGNVLEICIAYCTTVCLCLFTGSCADLAYIVEIGFKTPPAKNVADSVVKDTRLTAPNGGVPSYLGPLLSLTVTVCAQVLGVPSYLGPLVSLTVTVCAQVLGVKMTPMLEALKEFTPK